MSVVDDVLCECSGVFTPNGAISLSPVPLAKLLDSTFDRCGNPKFEFAVADLGMLTFGEDTENNCVEGMSEAGRDSNRVEEVPGITAAGLSIFGSELSKFPEAAVSKGVILWVFSELIGASSLLDKASLTLPALFVFCPFSSCSCCLEASPILCFIKRRDRGSNLSAPCPDPTDGDEEGELNPPPTAF